jgi:hypothetical protein
LERAVAFFETTMSNLQPFDRLTRPQRIALISILSADEPSRTASLARVTTRCIRNWRKLPVFEEALAEARRDFFSACRAHLNSSLAVAFQTVLRAADSSWNESDRLKASLFLLDRIGHSEMSALAPPESDSTSI